MNILIWAAPLTLLIVFELIADICAKSWSLGKHPYLWIAALLSYIIGNAFWLFALKNGVGLGRGAIIFSLCSEMLALIVGFWYFHEQVSVIQMIGIFLGVLSLILIFWD